MDNPTPAERAAADAVSRLGQEHPTELGPKKLIPSISAVLAILVDRIDGVPRRALEFMAEDIIVAVRRTDRQATTETPLAEIAAERAAQDAKWGQQDHDLIDPILADRGPVRLAEEHEVPTEERAKFLCQIAAERGRVTWAHILVEEVAEVVAAGDDAARARAELVQVAAVAVAAIEAIDRRAGGAGR